jgi:hypothetical protein
MIGLLNISVHARNYIPCYTRSEGVSGDVSGDQVSYTNIATSLQIKKGINNQ